MPHHALSEAIRRQCAAIQVPDPALDALAAAHLDNLTKPRGSLGRLEEVALQLFRIQGKTPLAARPACMFTIAADHGVVEEGVASSPQAVTIQMVYNFMNKGAAINALCASSGVDLRIVDVGVANHSFPAHPLFIDKKVGHGTANLARQAAMSEKDCSRAIMAGMELAALAAEQGYKAVGTGEMGIGNTTPSSALFCAYLGFGASEMTGAGAGAPPAGLRHKTAVIEQGLRTHREVIANGDPLAILAALGGYEIAALTGLILGAASSGLTVMVDGFIATAAFTAARQMAPAVEGYCFFSHGSAEAGHGLALERLGKRPLLDLGMRLGEGTGAALGLFLLEAAANAFNSMATFESAGVER